MKSKKMLSFLLIFAFAAATSLLNAATVLGGVNYAVRFSAEREGGAGYYREARVTGGSADGKYLVFQVTSGDAEDAVVTVTAIELSEASSATISYQEPGSFVEAWLAESLPDLTGDGELGTEIYAYNNSDAEEPEPEYEVVRVSLPMLGSMGAASGARQPINMFGDYGIYGGVKSYPEFEALAFNPMSYYGYTETTPDTNVSLWRTAGDPWTYGSDPVNVVDVEFYQPYDVYEIWLFDGGRYHPANVTAQTPAEGRNQLFEAEGGKMNVYGIVKLPDGTVTREDILFTYELTNGNVWHRETLSGPVGVGAGKTYTHLRYEKEYTAEYWWAQYGPYHCDVNISRAVMVGEAFGEPFDPQHKYSVTVDPSITNGIIKTSAIEATAASTIDLTSLISKPGYRLVPGSLKYNGLPLTRTTQYSGVSFTMPAADVIITAEYEPTTAVTRRDFVNNTMRRTYQAQSGDEINLPYRLFVPEGPADAGPYPVFLFLHGSSENGTNNEAQIRGNMQLIEYLTQDYYGDYPCIIVTPQTPSGSAARDRAVNSMMSMMDGLLEELAGIADPDRVYVMGFSSGGYQTLQLAKKYDKVAAAVPICGFDSPGQSLNNFNAFIADPARTAPYLNITGLPIWFFHAEYDASVNVAWSKGLYNLLWDNGSTAAKLTIYDDGPGNGYGPNNEAHACWFEVFEEPEIVPWMFAQTKAVPSEKIVIPVLDSWMGGRVETSGAKNWMFDDYNQYAAVKSFDELLALGFNPMQYYGYTGLTNEQNQLVRLWRTAGAAWNDANRRFDVQFLSPYELSEIWLFDGGELHPAYNPAQGNSYEFSKGKMNVYAVAKTGAAVTKSTLLFTYELTNGNIWVRQALDAPVMIGEGLEYTHLRFEKVSTDNYYWESYGPYPCDVNISRAVLFGVPQGGVEEPDEPKTITVDPSLSHGKIALSRDSAFAGTRIEFETLWADPGYRLVPGSLKANDAVITGVTFDMPNENVVITARFEPASEIAGPRTLAASAVYRTYQAKSASENNMKYRLFVPEGPRRLYPVLLFIHGAGENGVDNEKQLTINTAFLQRLTSAQYADYPCIIVTPQFNGAYYRDVDTLSGLIDSIYEEFAGFADPNRLYVMGLSNGGGATMIFTRDNYRRVAAAAPMCAWNEGLDNLENTPMWLFHGDSDPTISVANSRAAYAALLAKGSTVVKYTEFAGVGHNCWDSAYNYAEPGTGLTLAQWMFAQKMAGPPVYEVAPVTSAWTGNGNENSGSKYWLFADQDIYGGVKSFEELEALGFNPMEYWGVTPEKNEQQDMVRVWRTNSGWSAANRRVDVTFQEPYKLTEIWMFDGAEYHYAYDPVGNNQGNTFEISGGIMEVYARGSAGDTLLFTYRLTNGNLWVQKTLDSPVTIGPGLEYTSLRFNKVSTDFYQWEGGGNYSCDVNISRAALFGEYIGEEREVPDPTPYSVSVDPAIAHGRVAAAVAAAKAGTRIKLETLAAEAGYRLTPGSLKFNGTPITGVTFTMPAENVVITAAFEPTAAVVGPRNLTTSAVYRVYQPKTPDEVAMPYRLFIPEGPADQTYPVVMFLHGLGENGTNNESQLGSNVSFLQRLTDQYFADHPCIIVAPQFGQGFDREVATLPGILDSIYEEFAGIADTERLYVMGLSQGGFATMNFIAQNADRVAAAAVFAGWNRGREDLDKLVGMPIWLFHCADDGTVYVGNSRDAYAYLRSVGSAAVKYTEFPTGGHNAWNLAYGYTEPGTGETLLTWMFAQRKGND